MEGYVHKIKRARLLHREDEIENQVNSVLSQESINTNEGQMGTSDLNRTGQGRVTTTLSQESVASTSTKRKVPTKPSHRMATILTPKIEASTSFQATWPISTLKSVASTSFQAMLPISTPKSAASTSFQATLPISTPKSAASTSTIRMVPTITSTPISVAGTSTKRKLSTKQPLGTLVDPSSVEGMASTSWQGTMPMASTSTIRMVPTITSTPMSIASTSTKGKLPIKQSKGTTVATSNQKCVPSTSTQRKAPTKSTQGTSDATSSPMCVAGTSTQESVAKKQRKAEAKQEIQRVPFIPYDYDALNECVSHFQKDENGDMMPLLYQSRADMGLSLAKFDELESKNNPNVKKIRAVQIPPYAMIFERVNELKKAEHAMNNTTTASKNDEDNDDVMTDENILKNIFAQEDEKENLPQEVLENYEKAKRRDAEFQLEYVSEFLAGRPIDTSYYPNKAREYIKTGEISMEKAEARKINNQKSRESRMKVKKRRTIYTGSLLYLRESCLDLMSQYVMMKEMFNIDNGTQFGSDKPATNKASIATDSSDEECYRMPLEVVIKEE